MRRRFNVGRVLVLNTALAFSASKGMYGFLEMSEMKPSTGSALYQGSSLVHISAHNLSRLCH